MLEYVDEGNLGEDHGRMRTRLEEECMERGRWQPSLGTRV